MPSPPKSELCDKMGLKARIEQTSPIKLDVDFACAAGEVLAFVGPSGGGKSTLLRMLAGLDHPQQAFITCKNTLWCDTQQGVRLMPQQRAIGMVFQNYALFPHLNALENIMMAMGAIAKAERQPRARALLARVRLNGLEHRLPAALSGGQQQRVALARALAREPALLLLDEPFSAVDRATRQRLYIELAELRQELKMPILLVTHDLDEASQLADRLCLLHHGRILQTGTFSELKQRPVSLAVARLVDTRNVFEAKIIGHDQPNQTTLFEWQGFLLKARYHPQFLTQESIFWCLPASHILLHRRDRPSKGEVENPVDGVIMDMLPLGETMRLRVAIGAAGVYLTINLSPHVVERMRLEKGERVNLTLPEKSIHFLRV